MTEPALSVQRGVMPTFVGSTASIFRLQARRFVRGKKLRLALAAAFLIVFADVAARYASAPSAGASPEYMAQQARAAVTDGMRWGFFQLLVFMLPFLFASAAIGEEVERRTFGYLAGRASGRIALVIGKWLAATVFTVAILVASLVLLHVAAYATSPTAMFEALFANTEGEALAGTLNAAFALVLLGMAYCSVCMFFGAVAPEAAGVSAALYLAIIEFLFSFMPSVFRAISLNYSAQQLAGLPKGGLMADSAIDISAPIASAVLLFATVLFLGLSTLVVQTSEYRFAQS